MCPCGDPALYLVTMEAVPHALLGRACWACACELEDDGLLISAVRL